MKLFLAVMLSAIGLCAVVAADPPAPMPPAPGPAPAPPPPVAPAVAPAPTFHAEYRRQGMRTVQVLVADAACGQADLSACGQAQLSACAPAQAAYAMVPTVTYTAVPIAADACAPMAAAGCAGSSAQSVAFMQRGPLRRVLGMPFHRKGAVGGCSGFTASACN